MRISNSFSEDEIQVLDFITQTLLRGGDPRIATRNKAFGSVCRKVIAMKAKVNELKQRPAREQSSVGTVASPALTNEAAGASDAGVSAHEAHGAHGAHDAHDAHDDIAAAV
jgi:hypothetical protein